MKRTEGTKIAAGGAQCGIRGPARSTVTGQASDVRRGDTSDHPQIADAFVARLAPSRKAVTLGWLKVVAEREFEDWENGGRGTCSRWLTEKALHAALERAGVRCGRSRAGGVLVYVAKRLEPAQ